MKKLALTTLFTAALLSLHAQIGTGWTTPSFYESLRIEPGDDLIPAANIDTTDLYYNKNTTTGVRTFKFKTINGKRVEIRPHFDYNSGQYQFEGYLKFTKHSQAADYQQTTVFQDHAVVDHEAWKFWLNSTGVLWSDGGYGAYVFKQISSGSIYGVEQRINYIHNASSETVQAYLNASLIYSGRDDGKDPSGRKHYPTYGMYQGRVVATVTWRNPRHWTRPAGVVFYSGTQYGGTMSQPLAKGTYSLSQLAAKGVANDSASSVEIPKGWTVKIYQNDGLGGASWTLTTSTIDFTTISGLNDAMSSCVIQ